MVHADVVRYRWRRRLDREHQQVAREIQVIETPSGWLVRLLAPVIRPDQRCAGEADALTQALDVMRTEGGDWTDIPANVSPPIRHGENPNG